jgi:hypothetical protein
VQIWCIRPFKRGTRLEGSSPHPCPMIQAFKGRLQRAVVTPRDRLGACRSDAGLRIGGIGHGARW